MAKKSHFERMAKHYDFLTRILMMGTYDKVKKEIVSLPRSETALDLCCGTGYVTGQINAERVIALDMSPGMLTINKWKNRSKKKVDITVGDAFKLPFPDASFDVVFNTLAAHEFKNISSILREAYRVLKEGGKLVLYDFTVPRNPILKYTYLPFLKHVVELGTFFAHGAEEWEIILKDVGFKKIESKILYGASILIHAGK
jgi:demethylmenaquinone methyltransferase/2-methoxy-6-polyprenyl-1,4-benzoquinol methylase